MLKKQLRLLFALFVFARVSAMEGPPLVWQEKNRVKGSLASKNHGLFVLNQVTGKFGAYAIEIKSENNKQWKFDSNKSGYLGQADQIAAPFSLQLPKTANALMQAGIGTGSIEKLGDVVIGDFYNIVFHVEGPGLLGLPGIKVKQEVVPGYEWGHAAVQGKRPTMEDAHAYACLINSENIRNSSYVFGVFDGHGGDRVAKKVATLMPQELKAGNVSVAFENIEKEIRARRELMQQGSTAIVAVAHSDKLEIANLGDSRCVLIDKEGIITFETKDHKIDNEQEAKRIFKAGNEVFRVFQSQEGKRTTEAVSSWEEIKKAKKMESPWRIAGLAMPRSFGDIRIKQESKGGVIAQPEIFEQTMNADDIMILACDGVWDVMSSQDVTAFIVDHKNAKKDTLLEKLAQLQQNEHVAQVLEKSIEYHGNSNEYELISLLLAFEAIKRGSTDNVSVMVVRKPASFEKKVTEGDIQTKSEKGWFGY